MRAYSLIAQVDDMVKVVDRAATASDRWLFLFVLALLITGFVIALKFLATALTGERERADANSEKMQKKYDELTTRIYSEHTRLTAEVTVALKENSDLISESGKSREALGQLIKENNVLLERLWHDREQQRG